MWLTRTTYKRNHLQFVWDDATARLQREHESSHPTFFYLIRSFFIFLHYVKKIWHVPQMFVRYCWFRTVRLFSISSKTRKLFRCWHFFGQPPPSLGGPHGPLWSLPTPTPQFPSVCLVQNVSYALLFVRFFLPLPFKFRLHWKVAFLSDFLGFISIEVPSLTINCLFCFHCSWFPSVFLSLSLLSLYLSLSLFHPFAQAHTSEYLSSSISFSLCLSTLLSLKLPRTVLIFWLDCILFLLHSRLPYLSALKGKREIEKRKRERRYLK